jgi:hypothetical protein
MKTILINVVFGVKFHDVIKKLKLFIYFYIYHFVYTYNKMDIFEDNINKEITGKQLNSYGIKFYKFINKEKCHFGMNFTIGENIDSIEFSPNQIEKYNGGGMYFTTMDHIFKFISFGCYLCEILIHDDARCYIENGEIKSNKFFIKNMINIKDLHEFSYNYPFCVRAVKQNGHMLQFIENQTEDLCLEAVKQNGYALKFIKEQTE